MTSVVSDEIQTNTSEDFGFKSLGQSAILPSYNEKLPFARLENFDISNKKSLFVAYSGGRLIVGRLQVLRDFIVKKEEEEETGETGASTNTGNDELLTLCSHDIPGVVFCKFDRQAENVILVTQQGVILALDLKSFDIRELVNLEKSIVQVKLAWDRENRDVVLVLDGSANLTCLSVTDTKNNSGATQILAENVASFDFDRGRLLLLSKQSSNSTVQIFDVINFKEPLSPLAGFPIPTGIMEEDEELVPLDIKILSDNQFLLVVGNLPSADKAEDIMYDQKMFILDYNADTEAQNTEGVNSTSSSLVFRESLDIAPAYGTVLRFPYFYHVKLHNLLEGITDINIISSSCASDLTIFDSREVVQPSQDSERAVLPINQNTDNDTNPIGMALDYSSNGIISEPCSGVDRIEKLPLIYVLNNEGTLLVAGLYHESAIKEGKFHVENLGSEGAAEETPLPTAAIESEEPTLDELSLADTKNEPVKNAEISGNESLVGNAKQISEAKEKSPVFSFKALQESTTSNLSNKSVFGQPAFGQFNKTSSEQSLQTESVFGRPAFGSVSFGAQTTGQSVSPSQSQVASSAFGKPVFGNPSFGTQAFGNKSPEGQTQPGVSSPFGKPVFGSPSFGKNTSSSNSPFQFGAGTNSGFGKFSNKNESPFAKLTISGESPFRQASTSTSSSPFSNFALNKESPFAKIKEQEEAIKREETGKVLTSREEVTEAPKNGGVAAGFKDGTGFSESLDESSTESSSSSSSSLSDSSITDEEGTVGGSVTDDLKEKFVEKAPPELGATNLKENEGVGLSESGETPKIEKIGHGKPKGASTISALTEKIKQSAQLSADTTKPTASSIFGKTSPLKGGDVSSPFSQYAKLISEPSKSPFSFSNNVPNPFIFNKTTFENGEQHTSHTKSGDSKGKDDVSAVKLEGQPSVDDSGELLRDDKGFNIEIKKEEPGTDTSHVKEGGLEVEEQKPSVETLAADDQSSKISLEGGKIELTRTESGPGVAEEKNGPVTSVNETETDKRVDQKSNIGEKQNDEGAIDTERGAEPKHENKETSTHIEQKHKSDAAMIKPENADAEVQTASPELVDRSTQIPRIPVVDAGVQMSPKEFCDFEVQSFENDENYLAEIQKPSPLSDYFVHASVGKIPYGSSDSTLRAFERTYHMVSAEFSVLEENIKNLDIFFSDQSAIKLDERTEKSMCNLYTWRIPESARIQSILAEKSSSIASYGELLGELDRKTEEFWSSMRFSTDKEVQLIRRAHSELQYLLGDSSDKKLVELSEHQARLQKRLRTKLSEVSERTEKIEEMLDILKVYITKSEQVKDNQLLRKVASELPSLSSLLDSIKLLQKQVESLKLNEASGVPDNIGALVLKEEPESSKVVEVGLQIDTRKKLGSFFKNRLGY